MFKMIPIQYKFQPKYESTKNIYNKCIIAEPFEWNNGYGIIFMVETEMPIEGKIIGSRKVILEQYEYFDKDVDYDLSLLFSPLYKGEIRGQYAERIIWNIFFKLCRKEKWLKNNFPKYVEFLDCNQM